MTVTYTASVSTCKRFSRFLILLFRWRGSIYKVVYPDLLVFLLCYYSLNFSYRYVMSSDQKKKFEHFVELFESNIAFIPLSMILGFYVTLVMNRWWNQYTSIPFPDSLAVLISTSVIGLDEQARLMRRSVARYVCLCITMTFTKISPSIKKRFPTLDHLVDAGLLEESEKVIMDHINESCPKYSKYWMPLVWAATIVSRARKECKIRNDFAVKTIIDEINLVRKKCGTLLSYDTISIPIVYTQTVTIAVYSHYLATLIGHQWTESKNQLDTGLPFFAILQFFFYMGLLRVAEILINPFGDDDDDFEINWMIDRNLQVAYLIVDDMHNEHPDLTKDQYWDTFPQELPHTVESQMFKTNGPEYSTDKIVIPDKKLSPISKMRSRTKSGRSLFEDDGKNSGIQFIAKCKSDRIPSNVSSNWSLQTNTLGSLPRRSSSNNFIKNLLPFRSKEDTSHIDGIPMITTVFEPKFETSSITNNVISQVIEEEKSQLSSANSSRKSISIECQKPVSDFIPIPKTKMEYFNRSISNNSNLENQSFFENKLEISRENDDDFYEKLKVIRKKEESVLVL